MTGQMSPWITINRGSRQGDPLSPYIFILCAEILAALIRKNKDIQGIKIENKEYLIEQYADDTEFILDGTKKFFEGVIDNWTFLHKYLDLK